ncbi:hypothetical protein DV738_g3067, partial [Chaetothyriales sp. CBS 135597]
MAVSESAVVDARDAAGTPYKLNPEQTLKASRALLEHLKRENKRIEQAAVKKELLRTDDSDGEDDAADDATPIWLSLTTKQHIVDRNCLRPSKAKVPHSLTSSPNLSICIITADPQRAVKNIVADPRFPTELAGKIERVIGLTKLLARYKSFEQRRELRSQHDVFLADDRIITRLPKALGKVFYQGTAKRPIPINIALIPRDEAGKKIKKVKPAPGTKKDAAEKTALFASPEIVAKEISRALDSVPITVKQGTNTAVRVGLSSFTPEQLVDNINAVVSHVIEKHVVKGWRNVKAIHIKTPASMALPIWLADELWTETNKVVEQPANEEDNNETAAIEAAWDGDSKSSKRKRNPKTTKGPQAGARKKTKVVEDNQDADADADAGKESAKLEAARKEALKKQKAKAFKSDIATYTRADNRSLGFDPHKYTSGRWLRLDEQQFQARYIAFDFDKLCKKAIACSPGARDIAGCLKLEGGFNRAFVLRLDNGASIVARVPFSVAGPARLTTNSEVATMEYIRRHTSIPVPAVLDWSDDPQNPVGTEYIIMEHAVGVQLHQQWPSMTAAKQLDVVKALGHFAREMYKLQFPAFGSLYFADAPVEKDRLIPIGGGFSVGPHCGTRYWPGQPGDERSYQRRPPNHGPWTTHEQYCRGLVDAGYSRVPPTTPPDILEYKGTVEEHLSLSNVAQQTLLQLSQSDALKPVERPMLLHHDMNKRNIFVSEDNPGQITSIIDWQSSSIEPVHHYSDGRPDLCDFPDTWDETEVQDPPSKEQQKIIKAVSICCQAWDVMMRGWLPELHTARTMDQDFLRLFRYVPSAWRHSATALRDDLIQLSAHWSNPLGLPGSCPYQPSEAEISRHKTLWEEFKLVHGVKEEVVRGFATDEEGWIPIDRWEDTKLAYGLLFHEWLKGVVDSGEMSEDMARKVWPFDLPQ